MVDLGTHSRHHVEAYPRLNLRDARKFCRKGLNYITWRNQNGTLVGVGIAEVISGDNIEFSYQFRSIPYIASVGDIVRFRYELREVDDVQQDCLTLCSGCRQMRRIIVFKNGIWNCQSCQYLGYRSNMIGELARKTEKLLELERETERGRPKGMHNSTFGAKVAELDELREELGKHRGYANADFHDVLKSHWGQPGPDIFF